MWPGGPTPLFLALLAGALNPIACVRPARDEFNSTEAPFKHQPLGAGSRGPPRDGWQTTSLLKKLLLRHKLDDCCPSWTSLARQPEMQDEQRPLFGAKQHKLAGPLRAQELLNELRQAFTNITYLSIEGQEAESQWEKYYQFYDDVQYYLRLMIVAKDYLAHSEPGPGNGTSDAAAGSAELAPTERKRQLDETEFRRHFRRQLSRFTFKLSRDPVISSYLAELLPTTPVERLPELGRPLVANENFELYEDFIRHTEFGRHYARNISMVRESVQLLDLICSHLAHISFPSNLTRPSKQYEIIRRLSLELYRIRRDLLESVNVRILDQHPDIKRTFDKLDDLAAERPEIRLLGDQFSDQPAGELPVAGDGATGLPDQFGASVRQLARLLDGYTRNNMTRLSFYEQLAGLPEDFILLGLAVAREYESRELAHSNPFFYQLELAGQQLDEQRRARHNESQSGPNATQAGLDSARQSNRPFLAKLFG